MAHALGGGLASGAPAPHGIVALALGASAPVGSVMVWLGVLFVIVLVGGFLLLFLRRWLLDSGLEEETGGWDLRALRTMRDRGEITEEEFQIARERIIDAYTRAAKSPRPAGSPQSGSPPGLGGEMRAPPGFDLTGEPLPDFGDHANDGQDGERPKK